MIISYKLLFLVIVCLKVSIYAKKESESSIHASKAAELEFNKTQWLEMIRPSLLTLEKTFPPFRQARIDFHEKYPNNISYPTLQDKSIFYIGDSTFRNQFQAFCIAMHTHWEYTMWDPYPISEEHSSDSETYTDISQVSTPPPPSPQKKQTSKFNEAFCLGQWKRKRVLAVYIEKVDFGSPLKHIMAGLPPPFANKEPDIIYFGSGQWLMWPVPFTVPVARWATFDHWKNIEKEISFVVNKYETMSNVKQIVTSTVHSTCENNEYVGDWYEIFNDFKVNETKCMLRCVESLPSSHFNGSASPSPSLSSSSSGKKTVISDQVINIAKMSVCRAGFRSDASVVRMNSRIKATMNRLIRTYQASHPNTQEETPSLMSIINNVKTDKQTSSSSSTLVQLHLLDAYKITHGHCEANVPKDQIHYVALIFKEVEELLRLLKW